MSTDPQENSGRELEEDIERIYGERDEEREEEKEEECSGSDS